MDDTSRPRDPSVKDTLFQQGYDFNFFQAVRVLERLFPDRKSVGRDALPSEEVVRFKGNPSLAFAISDIQEVKVAEEGDPVKMTVNFLGLAGRQGALPLHYTEFLLNRRYKNRDTSAAAFFDLFLHRLTSLFYRAWEKHSLAAQYEREQVRGAADESGVTQFLFDLIGLGTEGLRSHARDIEDRVLVFYSGLIAQRPHSVVALEGMLADFFQVPIRVEQFRGKWFPLAPEEFSDMREDCMQNYLGEGAVLGDAVWHPQARIRLHVGPLTRVQFDAFLPAGSAFAKLLALTRFFLDWSVDFDVQLSLLAAQVPEWKLADDGPEASLLGLTSWLRTSVFHEDAKDVVLSGVPGKEVRAMLASKVKP